MNGWPAVTLWVPILAGAVAMILGTAYWITRGRLTQEPAVLPAVPVRLFSLASRIVVAYGLAVIIGFAGAKGFAAGLLVGALVYVAFPGMTLLAQANFGVIRWKDVRAALPEALVGFAVMGGISGAFAR